MAVVQRRMPRPTTATSSPAATDDVNAASNAVARRHHACACKQQHQQQSPAAPVSCDDDQLEGILFVVGDALLDVCADVSREFIQSHHLQFGRAIVATDTHKGHVKSPSCGCSLSGTL